MSATERTERLELCGEQRRAVVSQFVVGRRNLNLRLVMEEWHNKPQGGNGNGVKNEKKNVGGVTCKDWELAMRSARRGTSKRYVAYEDTT